MRAKIGPDLLRRLPQGDRDIRDDKLAGFILRCRASGAHSFLVQLGRGRVVTLGRVGDLAPEAARVTAQAMLASVSRDTLKLLADDPTVNLRDARARARGALRGPRANRRATWQQFVSGDYATWARANRRTGDEMVKRLQSQFATFDTLRLAEISAFAIERWRAARLKSGVTHATVNRDFNGLRAALGKAVEWGALKAHPMTAIKPATVDTLGRIRFLNPEEERRLITALEARDDRRREERARANDWRQERGYPLWPPFGRYTDHLTPIVLLALHSGCRRGELFGLRWADLDLAAAQMTVRAEGAKSGHARVIPLNTAALAVLRDWRPRAAKADDYVFPSADGGPLHDLKTAFLKLVRRAKVERFRFHDLRHTFASKLVQAGVDLNTVRELLGHADIKMTLRYAHLAPEHRAAAVAKLVSTR